MGERGKRALAAFEVERVRRGWPSVVSDVGHRCTSKCDWWCFPQDRSMRVCRYTGRLHACTADECPGPFVETSECTRVCCITGQEHGGAQYRLSFNEMDRYSYALARPDPTKPRRVSQGGWGTQEERSLVRMLVCCLRDVPGNQNKDEREREAEEFVNRCRRIHGKLSPEDRPDARKFVFALAIWLRESRRDTRFALFFRKHLVPTTTMQKNYPKQFRKLSKAQKSLLTCMQGKNRNIFSSQLQ